MRWCRVCDSRVAAGNNSDIFAFVDDNHDLLLSPDLELSDLLSGASQDHLLSLSSLPTQPVLSSELHSASPPAVRYSLLAPVCRPSKVLCAGLNYAAHAAEFASATTPAQGGISEVGVPRTPDTAHAPTLKPLLLFSKLPSAVTAPRGEIRMPRRLTKCVDYEGEICAISGQSGSIRGYTLANDVTARDLQRTDGQWTRAKGFDTFLPLGPYVLTPEELGGQGPSMAGRVDNALAGVVLQTWVNGKLRQEARGRDMLRSAEEILAYCSDFASLEEGDLVLTGTPSGVGMGFNPPKWLQDGDEVVVRLETGKGFSMELSSVCRSIP